MTSALLGPGLGELGSGGHVCAVIDSEQDRKELAGRFVRDGLAADERVWYLTATTAPAQLLDLIRADDLDVDGALRRGQLAVLSSDDSYLRQPPFDPQAAVDMVNAAVDDALAAGYAGFRVAGEMSWSRRGVCGTDRLLEYERLMGDLLEKRPAAAICQYDRAMFPEPTLSEVLDAHPQCWSRRSQQMSIRPLTDRVGLRIDGEVDLCTHGALRRALAGLPAAGEVHLDLGGLAFIDVAGVGALAELAAPPRVVVLHSPPPEIRQISKLLWPDLEWRIE